MSEQTVPLLASNGMNEVPSPTSPGFSVVLQTPEQTPAATIPGIINPYQ